VCTNDSYFYICFLCFVGGNGRIKKDPDPISAVASEERVILSICAFITLNEVIFEVTFYTRSWVSRLNRKRKASCEREAGTERSKKICLKRSVAKTHSVTLNRHTEKSEEMAAMTLLDQSSEPVIGEPDEKNI